MSRHRAALRLSVVTLTGLVVAIAACRGDRTAQAAPPPADTVAQLDTQTAHVVEREPPKPALSPLADSIAERLVFPRAASSGSPRRRAASGCWSTSAASTWT